MFDSLLPRARFLHTAQGRANVEIPLPRPPLNSASEWARLVAPVNGVAPVRRARRWPACLPHRR